MGNASRLTQGWALVTGASAGLGKEFAIALARRGMNVVISARRADRLQALAEALRREARVEVRSVPIDLAAPGAAGRLWASASESGSIGLLVNNAGFGLKGEFQALSSDRQAEMIRLNCVAPLELMHHAIAEMRRGGRQGAVINVASIASYQPIPSMATYAATKAFLASLSEAVAEECRDAGIRVVTLNPGPVATEFQAVAGTQVTARTPGVRSPEQVVESALHRLERGGGTEVPGALNRWAARLVRIAPRGWAVRMAKAAMHRLR